MGRLVRVVLYAVVVLVVYFWVISLLKSYREKENLKNATIEIAADTTQVNSLPDTTATNQEIVSGYEELDKAIEELSEDEPVAAKNPEEKKPAEKKPVPQNADSGSSANNQTQGSGPFMVIAGSFIKEENARQQIKKLKSYGYNAAEIKIFVASEYHSVIVSRHANPADAERVVQDLKKKGIESFVKEKK